MPATSVDLRSEREAPDRTAQQSYREELERQMCEKKAWREREKKEIEAYELKADLKVKQDLAEQEAKAAGPGAARAADKGKENSTRPAPDRTAEQSWREELERQVYEKKVRLEHEKKEIEAYELKADLKLKQDLAELAAGPGAAYKGKENSAVQQDQQQAPQQGQPSQPLAHISKVLPTTEQPIQEGTHDPPTHLDRQPNQGGHDRKPQAARPTHDPPHVDRQLEAEWRQRHISSSAGHISTSADGDLRRQLEHERQRVRQLTDECEALRQREAQQQQQLRAVQERQGEWERRRAQDELEWRSLLEVALHSQGPLGALFGALSGSLSGGAPPLATDAPAAWDTRLRAWAWAWAWAWVAPRTQRRASAAQAAVAAHAASVSTCRQRQYMPPASARADAAHLAPQLASHLAPRSAQVAAAGGAEDAGGSGADAARGGSAAAAAGGHAAAACHPCLHSRPHPRQAVCAVRARGPIGHAAVAPRHAAGVGGRPAGGRDRGAGRCQCLRVRCVRLQAAVCRPQSAAQAWVRGPQLARQAGVCGPALVGGRRPAAALVGDPAAAAASAFQCRLRYGGARHGTERGGTRHRAERGAAEASRRLPQAWHRPSRWQSPSRRHLPSKRGAADFHHLTKAARGAAAWRPIEL